MKQNSTERKCPDYLLTSCLIFTRSTMNICILNISTGENWQKGNIQGQWLRDEWSSLEAVMTLSLSLVVCGPYASSEQTTHIPQPSIILSSRKVSSLTYYSVSYPIHRFLLNQFCFCFFCKTNCRYISFKSL